VNAFVEHEGENSMSHKKIERRKELDRRRRRRKKSLKRRAKEQKTLQKKA
jgi:hypothetical protein